MKTDLHEGMKALDLVSSAPGYLGPDTPTPSFRHRGWCPEGPRLHPRAFSLRPSVWASCSEVSLTFWAAEQTKANPRGITRDRIESRWGYQRRERQKESRV